jgi:hypothetical protein
MRSRDLELQEKVEEWGSGFINIHYLCRICGAVDCMPFNETFILGAQ